ncbi:TPA: GW domain-containing glycosaminoglycan-binding protein [Bacillus pseudomycoides]|nr:GW domain-containing glycosaminoglycan-binding protein [Bacillus pseudomycoides]
MNKLNKLKQHSKSVIVSTSGVCLLLVSPTYMKAETLKIDNVKVQDSQVNNELKDNDTNTVDNNNGKQEELKNNVSKTETSQEGKEVRDKTEDKKENKEENSNNQKEVKPQAGSLEVNQEEKVNYELTRSKPITKETDTVQIDENQIIEFSNGDGIWSLPYGIEGAYYIDSTNKYAGKEVKLIQKMNVNNVVWYQFSVDGQTIGWLDGKVLSKLTNIQDVNQDAIIGSTNGNAIWSIPYGIKGANYIDSTSKYAYIDVKLLKKAMYGSTTWYKFSVDGKIIGWMDSKALDTGDVKPANFDVTIGDVSSQHGIWSKPYGTADAQYLSPANNYAYQTVKVVKTMKVGSTNWYQVKNDKGIIGWIDGDKATSNVQNLPINRPKMSVSTVVKSSDGIWTKPYGEPGANWITSVSDYSFKRVKVIQRVKKSMTVWCKIKLDDKVLGWVDEQTLVPDNFLEENKIGFIGDVNGHAIWTIPYGLNGSKYVGSVQDYMNKPIKITSSNIMGATTWYKLIVDDREIGWVDSRAISNATDIRTMNKVYHISNTQDHAVWTRPYGLQNASWVGTASEFKNKNLNVEMSVNYNGTTWFGFSNGRGGLNWIDSRAVSEGTTFPHMDVPVIQQRDYYNPSRDLLSGCEITAVTMMLQYAGANVDKVQLAYEMPYSSYDPNQGYVGNPWSDGIINTIYPPALMGLVNKYAGSAVNLTGKEIKTNLDNNKPVVVWVRMHGFGVHAITLTGYDDKYFYYNDPWTGEKDASIYWTDFYNTWDSQNRRAISY